jgi:RNA polymerase-binding transcription factor DksA
MADIIDIANDFVDDEVNRALRRIRQEAPKSIQMVKFCVECGDDIPAGRQKLGFKFCVPCAEESERRKLLFA